MSKRDKTMDTNAIDRAFANLEKRANSYDVVTENANVMVIRDVALFEARFITAGQEKEAKRRFREKLGRRAYDKGQTISYLAFQSEFHKPKSTASRWASIIEWATKEQHPFRDLPAFIKKHGGLSKCAQLASRKINGETEKSDDPPELRISCSPEVRVALSARAENRDVVYVTLALVKNGSTLTAKFGTTSGAKDYLSEQAAFGSLGHNSFGDISLIQPVTALEYIRRHQPLWEAEDAFYQGAEAAKAQVRKNSNNPSALPPPTVL